MSFHDLRSSPVVHIIRRLCYVFIFSGVKNWLMHVGYSNGTMLEAHSAIDYLSRRIRLLIALPDRFYGRTLLLGGLRRLLQLEHHAGVLFVSRSLLELNAISFAPGSLRRRMLHTRFDWLLVLLGRLRKNLICHTRKEDVIDVE